MSYLSLSSDLPSLTDLDLFKLAVDPGYTRLTDNRDLEDLTIGVLNLTQKSRGALDYGWILDTLSDLTPNKFRECKILIRIEDMSRFKDVPWNRIDAILTHKTFAAFQVLTIAVTDRTWLPWISNEESEKVSVADVLPVARRLLPKLAKKNALEVVVATQR